MAQATLDQVFEQASALSASEQLRLIALLAEQIRIHGPTGRDTTAEQVEQLTITERLARAGYPGGALFTSADDVDAYIHAERAAWER
jgi:hypothetical protein